MNIYAIWCDLRDSRQDLAFAAAVDAFLGHLRAQGTIADYTLVRRKFGFGPPELGEFHIAIRCRTLDDLDRAFDLVAPRAGETERLHVDVFRHVVNFRSALYRDFPDPGRT